MTTRDQLRLSLLAGAAASVLAAWPALAQQQTGLEEVVVTAQKREQNTIDVPIALTAVTASDISRLGVQQFDQLSLYVPGFDVQNQSPNNPGFVMRGITSDSGAATQEPRVSVFQDGVSISKSRGSFVELFDLDRVEVAKGPQSTLYGRGALIGAVNIVQAKAQPGGYDWRVQAETGNYDYKMLDGMVNLPLGETFAVRLSGRTKARQGYVKDALGYDDLNSLSTDAARLALKWEPSDRFSADVLLNYEQDFPTGTSFKSRAYLPTNPNTAQVLAGAQPWEPAALLAPADFEGGRGLGLRRHVWGATGLIDAKLSEAVILTSISAFRRFQSKEIFDADGISLPVLTAAEDARGKQWSQELRLRYDAGGAFSAFAGAAYFKEEGEQRVPTQFDERLALAQLTGQLNAGAAGLGLPANAPAPKAVFGSPQFIGALLQGAAAGLSGSRLLIPAATAQALAGQLRANHLETATNSAELTSWDLFADATFRPTDRLELSAGVRYTTDDKTSGYRAAVVGGRSVLGGVIGAAGLAATGGTAGLAQANAILQGLALVGSNLNAPVALPYFGLTAQPTANNGDTVSRGLDDNGLTWRLVGRYKLFEDANLYASYSRGRRPKVLSVSGPSAPFGAPRFNVLPAEEVDSYEAGLKTVLGARLRLDGSAYYYAYSNFQTVEQQGVSFITTNAGKAKAYGFEGQATWAFADQADLFVTYAYSHARFDGGAYDKNSFRLSPDHSFSAGLSWRVPLGGGELDVQPNVTWQSKVYFDDNNDLSRFQQTPAAFVADNIQDELQKAYGLVNFRIGYSQPGKPWRVEAFAKNLLNQHYIKDAGNTGDGLGLPTFIAGEPRFYGLSFTLRR